MIPIRHHHPMTPLPLVTYALIALNSGLFLAYWPLASDAEALHLLHRWGLVPARLSSGEGWVGLLSAPFLHAGWLHLGGNMLFLWIFGDTLEEELGRIRFLALYLACGLLGGLVHWVAAPGSTVPVVGASGAVAGVLGASMLLFPRARVDVLLWYVVGFRIIILPAWLLLGLWLALQLWGGLSQPPGGAGVAFWAHAGGFVAGAALCLRHWRARGGYHFWRRFRSFPPQPGAQGAIPVVRRPGVTLPPLQRGPFHRE
ncbi:rhomboid family intramembrane serine protease [Pararhodobacter sp.]|uniref:rhomboid family intramembrane serine protease n=1 Tax=Pararhodobacter sp. TaxID=2127056 RepID=UPI002FDE0275